MDSTHILLLENKADDAALIQLELEKVGLNFEYTLVKTEADYLKNLSSEIDLILADDNLPDFNTLKALDHLQNTSLDIPFIIISGVSNEEFAVECIKRGAADYLLKARLTRLGQAIQQAFQQRELRQRARALERSEREQLELINRATSLLFTPFTRKDLKTVGQEIVQAVVKEFDFVDCGVLVLDASSGQIIRLARTGTYEVRPENTLELTGPGLVPEAIRSGQTVYASDVSADPRYVATIRRTRSELVIPLISGEHIVGALDFQSPYLDAFNDRDQTLLEALAVRVGTMIENMQLYEQVRYYANELEERVEERTRALALEKERVEAILNSTNDTIILIRADVIEQVNPAFTEMFGYSEAEAVGNSLVNQLSASIEERWREVKAQLLRERTPTRSDMVLQHKDGSAIDVEVTLSLIRPDDDNFIAVNVRDISVRKQAEEGLRTALAREQELLELKSRFIAIVSHEFRNPLSMIQMSSATLENYLDRLDEADRARHFGNINTQVQHMTSLLEDVLAIESEEARRGLLRLMPTDLKSLCWEVVAGFRGINGQNRQIIYHYPETGLEKILIDPKLIRQLVSNLISNAVKYSKGDVRVNLTLEKGMVELSVQDEGIGIPDEDQQQLFQPFHRAKNTSGVPGTGLGLLVAKNAAELHGGTIHLESKVGVGTTVTITLPAIEEARISTDVRAK